MPFAKDHLIGGRAAALAPRVEPIGRAETSAPATRSLRLNFIINTLGAIVPLAVSLITVPIYIRHIGEARYGVLSIVWVLLGYLGFLDLGLSRAAANALARLREASQDARARVLVTTLTLNLGLGLIGAAVLVLAGRLLLFHLVKVPDVLLPEIEQAFPFVVALFPLALLSGVGIGALESREAFVTVNLVQVAGTSLGQIVPVLFAVIIGPSLSVVVPAAAAVRAATVVLTLGIVWRQEGPLRRRHFDRRELRGLVRYGGWVSVSGVIGPILTSLDQFVIGGALGIAAVTFYVVPMSLVTRSQIFAAALSRTLFPRFSTLSRDEAHAIALNALSLIAIGYGALCGAAIMITPVFFRFWVGPSFEALAAPIAQILFIGAWVNGIALIPFSFLQGQGRVDLTGKLHALEVAPFLALLWAATHAFGLAGAAGVWVLRCMVDMLLLSIASGLLGRTWLRLAAMVLALATAELFSMLLSPPPWVACAGAC